MKKLFVTMVALAAAACSYAQTLIAHYDFTNAATTATDLVNGLNGTSYNCISVPGRCGTPNTALKFDGSTSYVQVPGNTLLNLRAWTIQAVVWIDNFNTSTECQVSKILQHGVQYGSQYYALEINDNNDNIQQGPLNGCYDTPDTNSMRFFGAAAGTVPTYGIPSATVHTGRWYCLTAVYTDAIMYYYVDGVLTRTMNWTQQYAYPNPPSPPPMGYDLFFGTGVGSGGTTYWFDGVIDDIKIYNRSMTGAQVASLCEVCPCIINDIQYCSSLNNAFQYSFTANISDPSKNVMWDFGSGPVGPVTGGSGISNTFPGPGTYPITLSILDSNGNVCSDTMFQMCLSADGARPAANNAANSATGSTPAAKVVCGVTDIKYCGNLSTPNQFLFYPVVTPAGSQVIWDFGGGPTPPMASVPILAVLPTGSHHIILTVLDAAGNPCAHREFEMCVSPDGQREHAGVEQINYENNVGTPYPNPANSLLNIPVHGINSKVTMTVIGMDGATILSKNMVATESNSLLQLNTSALAPGVYMLQLDFGKQKLVKKFSKL